MASVVETIYTKFIKGNPLTDNELDIGINHFNSMGELLCRSGDVFRLAAQEANRVADRLGYYKRERSCP